MPLTIVPVATGALGAVQGLIGARDQLLAQDTERIAAGDANAARELDLRPEVHDRTQAGVASRVADGCIDGLK